MTILDYKKIKYLLYRHVKLSLTHELKPLNSNVDVIQFVRDIKSYEIIETHVEHLIDTPIIIRMTTIKKRQIIEEEIVTGVDEYKFEGDGKSECDTELEVLVEEGGP